MLLLAKKYYYDLLDQLFNDPTKYKILNEDPTLRNLSTIQRYLNTIELKGEITKDENKQMRPEFTHIGRAHGLPKIHNFLKYHLFDQLLTQPTHHITESTYF